MKGDKKTVVVAAIVKYNGISEITRLTIEYRHTGEYWYSIINKVQHIYSEKPTLENNKHKGKHVFYSSGAYHIDRLAIPSVNAKGQKDIWYINNDGDTYSIIKLSKFATKLHKELTQETTTKYKVV